MILGLRGFIIYKMSLLLRRECCSFSNGEYVKAGLAELDHWCFNATDEVIPSDIFFHWNGINDSIPSSIPSCQTLFSILIC